MSRECATQRATKGFGVGYQPRIGYNVCRTSLCPNGMVLRRVPCPIHEWVVRKMPLQSVWVRVVHLVRSTW